MPHLMTINIGPVQSFIEAARRTRDLWYGSWLVSELSKVALKVVLDNNGILISPAITADKASDKKYLSVNRILAVVDNPDRIGKAIAGTKEQAGALENFLLAQWYEVCRQIVDVKENEPFEPQIWNWLDKDAQPEAQIRDLVECQWVAVPYDDSKYKQCRDQAEALLAARKNTRNFAPVRWGRYKPKSSLDGTRESVIREELYPTPTDTNEQRKKKIKEVYRRFHAGPAERLSAVDLLKRLGNKALFEHIPSTSHIAARPFVEMLDQNRHQIADEAQALRNELTDLVDEVDEKYSNSQVLQKFDLTFLFENRLQSEAQDRGIDENRISAAKSALARFRRRVQSKLEINSEPSPYYALLLADGDNMGKTLDGLSELTDHQGIAQELDDFATEVRKTVEQVYSGALIYAGGDDVMALLPLHTVFDCAQVLAEKFHSSLKKRLEAMKTVQQPIQVPTLSCGITIAHHLEPLSDVLRLTRDAEKTAKKLPGKAAVAITLSKRSGVDRTIVGRWGDGFIERLKHFITLFENNQLPHGVAYELSNLYQRLYVPEHWFQKPDNGDYKNVSTRLQTVMVKEAARIFDRKRDREGHSASKGLSKKDFESYVNDAGTVQDIAYELIVAETLAAATPRNQNFQTKGATQ